MIVWSLKMKKIYIIGCLGSGKTTLARKLSKVLDIPYYELDEIAYRYENKKRRRVEIEEQKVLLNKIDSEGQWILEGVYRKSYDHILESCDTIIFLDTPLKKRQINIIKRFVKQQLGIEQCNYKSDLKMLSFMLQWNKDFEKTRYLFEKRLKKYEEKVIYIEKFKDIEINR